MYGQKEEAQDEDFFPYVMNTLTSPTHLQWARSSQVDFKVFNKAYT
jgi:hypothetical protein